MVARCLTVAVAYDRYLEPYLQSARVAKSTYHSHRANVRLWNLYGETRLDCGAIKLRHLRELRSRMTEAGYADATYKSVLRTLKQIWGLLLDDELIESMPDTSRMRIGRRGVRPAPTHEQVCRMIEHCGSARWPWKYQPRQSAAYWRTLIGAAYITGLRRGDLLRLRWSEHVTADGVTIEPSKTSRFGKQVWIPDVGGELVKLLHGQYRRCGDLLFPHFQTAAVNGVHDRISLRSHVARELVTFQPLRRASGNEWCRVDERAGGIILGHGLAMPAITAAHYVAPAVIEERSREIVRAAAGSFRVPAPLMQSRTG